MIVNRLILNDGSELCHVSVDEVKRLNGEKALGKDNLLQELADGKWLPLHAVFDTLQWDLEARRYRVIGAGGGEELDADVPTITELYRRNELSVDSMVLDNSDQRWLPLRDRFDTRLWGEPEYVDNSGEQKSSSEQSKQSLS